MLHNNSFTKQNRLDYNENFDDNSVLPFFVKPQNDPPRGQVQFCYNLTVILFEKGSSPFKQEFPEVRTTRQILDHYLKVICIITPYYGIFTIQIVSPKPNHTTQQIQTDDKYKEFSKVFTDNMKNIQHQNSQRAKSISTDDLFSLIYSYLSILALKKKTQNG